MWPFKRKEKESGSSLVIVKEDEIEKILKDELSKEVRPLQINFENFHNEIMEKIRKFDNSLDKLSNVTVSIPDPKTELLVNTRKKDFILKMKNMIKTFKKEVGEKPEDIIDYYNSCTYSWNYANSVALKDFIQIKDFFKNEAKEVINNFKDIYKTLETIGNVISDKKNRIEKIKESIKSYDDFKWLKKAVDNEEKKMEKIKTEIKELSENKKNKQIEIYNLQDSTEFKKLKELEKQKANLDYRQKEIASTIVEIFSSLDRPFKKSYRILSRENDPIAKTIKKFIESPFDALLSNESELNKILDKIKNLLKEKKLSLKSSEKVVKKIDDLLQKNVLIDLVKQYRELSLKLNEIEKEMNSIDINSKREKISLEIKMINEKILSKSEELKNCSKRLEEFQSLIEMMKEELQKSLTSILDKKIKIVFN